VVPPWFITTSAHRSGRRQKIFTICFFSVLSWYSWVESNRRPPDPQPETASIFLCVPRFTHCGWLPASSRHCSSSRPAGRRPFIGSQQHSSV
jgi:hypothetical protein